MADRVRPYLFYDVVVSICSTCYRKVEGKVLLQDGQVHMLKRCPQHGFERVLLADDAEYYRRCREVFLKPPEQANRYNTPIRYGCPYDCGLCPDHEQHSCLTLVEICDACNLECPVCYAESGPGRPHYRTLAQVEAMLDAVVANEREPDVVQISGGEPTLHPQFFEVLDAARRRPIRHLMVNTNGIRLARERAFAERLATYRPAFEVYLQFDSLQREALMRLRGADLRSVRRQAIDTCNELDIPANLVCTVAKGVNDEELGRIVEYALEQPCVRGVTFQPVQAAGRIDGYDPTRDRLTLTEVRRRILEQTAVFKPDDILPVPCHPDSLAMAYALKTPEGPLALTGLLPVDVLINGARNTINLAREPGLRDHIFRLFSTSHSPQSRATTLRELLCCLPKVEAPESWTSASLFRVIIMQFIDAWSFDVRSIKKTCVHIVHPDGRLIPFDTYNLFYRDGLEQSRLGPLRAEVEGLGRAPGAAPSSKAIPLRVV